MAEELRIEKRIPGCVKARMMFQTLLRETPPE